MPDPRPSLPPRSIVTIGTFDGVHRGHQALLARARQRAESLGPDVRVKALVFDPNPIEVLRPGSAPARLTTFEQKRDWLHQAGADEVVRLEPTSTLLHETPEEFLTIVRREHGMIGVVEGPDFRFGRGRAGDIRTLAALGAKLGFTSDIVEPVTVALNDHTIAPARSTMVRWLLSHGRVADAARVLGRPHTLRGTVVRGDRRGRTIGFPTANVESPCMAPADGVYAGRARLVDGRTFVAAVSIGTKPTFGEHRRAVEAVFLNLHPERSGNGQRTWTADHAPPAAPPGPTGGPRRWRKDAWQPLPGLPEYGWCVDLEIIAWIREQLRFDSLDALLTQMERDCAAVTDRLSAPQAAAADEPPAKPQLEAVP